MESGDLFFRVIETRYDSWSTVQEYLVYHWEDTSNVLAEIENTSMYKQKPIWSVTFPEYEDVKHVFDTLQEAGDFIAETYTV